MLVTRDILFEIKETFSHLDKKFPVRSVNATEWKSALRLVKRLGLFSTFHGRKIGDEARHMCHLAYCIPGVPKMFPYLSCYFIEIPRYLRKFIKGVYYTIPKLDLCTGCLKKSTPF